MPLLDDPVAVAGLTVREVRTGSRDGATTRIVVARRTYRTDQADLWDAVTNRERLPRWFLPVTGDLRVGGRYQLEGNAGGVVERCEAPTSLAVTWEMEGVSWLEVTLSPAPGGTTLELAHEAVVPPEFWAQFGPGAVGLGWDLALMGLGLHLATGAPVGNEAAEEFGLSAEGTEFVRYAAQRWAEAAIADGDDPDAAQAAAEGSIAFYTTPPEDAPPAE